MRKIFFTIFILFAFLTVAYSAEFYDCVDKDGNSFITDNPPPDAKCKTDDGDKESSSQEPENDVESENTNQDDEKKSEIKRLIKIKRPGY